MSALLRLGRSSVGVAVVRHHARRHAPAVAMFGSAAAARKKKARAAFQKTKDAPEVRLERRLTPLPKPLRYQGVVIGARMEKTVMVEVTRLVKDEKYQKIVAKRRKFAVHDEAQACRVGDLVEFAETRKFSKTKAHMVTNIVRAEDYIDRDEPRRRRTKEADFGEPVSINGS